MLDYAKLPNRRMLDSVRDYVERGVPPGRFLLALLENDLMGAFRHADDTNVALLREWCVWVHDEVPMLAHGSPEMVHRWMRSRRGDDGA